MPIINGKYKNPGWVNDNLPAIDEREMNALSDTLAKLDTGGGGGGPVSTLVTLSRTAWSNSRQTVTVSGVSANESGQLITPVPAAASQSAYYDAGIRVTAQAAGSLTFTAATAPTANLSVYVVVQEVG